MKRCHLLQTTSPPESFASLARAVSEIGERLGWLDWHPDAPLPEAPGDLAAAAALPALRAVAVGSGGSVAVKPGRGAPVLRDVVREHFRGALVVVVRAEDAIEDAGATDRLVARRPAPSLETDGELFVVRRPGATWRLEAEALARRLRRPRPFEVSDEP